MKQGDKIVCINTGNIVINGNSGRFYKKPVYKIDENKIYTVKNPDGGSDDIMIDGSHTWYHKDRFILLSKYRRKKINKIINGKERIT